MASLEEGRARRPAGERLPNLIVIGGQKCGTTSLWAHLDLHPEVSMSRPKEPHFFTANWDRGLDWYASCFPEPAPVRGEASTSYTAYPFSRGVPERMHSVIPDARLVYMVRDPIERMISQYEHHRVLRAERRPIDRVFSDPSFEGSGYVAMSRYHMQLARYLERFDLSRVKVLALEELEADPVGTLREMFRFLGVGDAFSSERFHHVHNPALDHRLRARLGRHGPRLSRAIRGGLPLGRRPVRTLERLLRQAPGRPALDPVVRDRVAAYVREDAQRLRGLVGRSFPGWSV